MARQILGEKAESEPPSATVGMGSKQAEVVVRNLPWVGGLEAFDQLHDIWSSWADELIEERFEPFLLFLGELSAVRGNPDRHGCVVAPHPYAGVPQGAADVEAPPNRQVLGVFKGPMTPERVGLEGRRSGLP